MFLSLAVFATAVFVVWGIWPGARSIATGAGLWRCSDGGAGRCVVRDADGKLVTDLEAKDFTVFEDGVRQTMASFEPALGRHADSTITEPDAPTAPATAAARAVSGPTCGQGG